MSYVEKVQSAIEALGPKFVSRPQIKAYLTQNFGFANNALAKSALKKAHLKFERKGDSFKISQEMRQAKKADIKKAQSKQRMQAKLAASKLKKAAKKEAMAQKKAARKATLQAKKTAKKAKRDASKANKASKKKVTKKAAKKKPASKAKKATKTKKAAKKTVKKVKK